MQAVVVNAALMLISYLLGSIPAGLLLARLKGVDIRKVGSGNIGATNVFRSVSKPLGVAAFVFDFFKGLVSAAAFPLLAQKLGAGPGPYFGLFFGCAAIVGHNWPVYLRFRGGKGVATSAGVLLGVAPTAMAIGAATWILLLAATRYVSVASIGAAIAVPIASWLLYADRGLLLPAALTMLGLVVVLRHRSNLKRLLAGTEHRFGRPENVGGPKPPSQGVSAS